MAFNGITATHLLQKEHTTAPELAARFEVSRRTINRDIEILCRAGIPIQTMQGSGGGIRIIEGYRMDRTILTSKDMQMSLAGLRSLDRVSGSTYYRQLMEKLQSGSSKIQDKRSRGYLKCIFGKGRDIISALQKNRP